ncbi:hypothetical protein [Nocardia callitridis]
MTASSDSGFSTPTEAADRLDSARDQPGDNDEHDQGDKGQLDA